MTLDLNLLGKVSADRALGAAMLFGHRHPQESAPMHVEMMDLWRCADEFVEIEAFREGGKSTVAEEAMTLEGAFGNFPYGLLIGETYTKACQRLAAIDYEARRNTKLHHLFGGKVLARKSTENRVWFKSGAMLEALGWEQELQSFKEFEHRPAFVWLDDIENQERVRDTETVDANMRKFWLELVPALDKTRRRIRYTQTRRAEDCMVTRFMRSGEWLYRGYPICTGHPEDSQTRSNWPARYPMEWIRAEYQRYVKNGMEQEFRQAYMLQATNPETKPFKSEMLASIEVSPWHWMARHVIYDPARTTQRASGKDSDRYGKVVVSRMASQILVHESGGAHWKPSEFIDDVFAANEKHSPAKIAVEKNSLDDWLMQPLRIAMLDRGVALPLVGLNAPQDRSKEEFIMGLQPFAQAKDIVLVGGRANHPQLVAEFLNFPQGTRDIMNCLAYSLRMFSGTPVYGDFSAANIGESPDPKPGETVHVAFNAGTSETVFVALLRDGRRLFVAADGAANGADAVKDLAFSLRATFPRSTFSVWAPAEIHDQWQRIPLVPRLRAENVTAIRGEHSAIARGAATDRIRMTWHGSRLLVVDRKAKLTLNALSTGYAVPVGRGGRMGGEPEEGISRLVGEALECVVKALDRELQSAGLPAGAHIGHTPSGIAYVSAHPGKRG